MGLLTNILNNIGIEIPDEKTKSPSLYVSEVIRGNNFEELVARDDYLSQYVGWVYKAAKIRAQACAKMELKHFYKTTKNKIDQVPYDESVVLNDLWKFNEYQTLYQARELIHLHLALTGAAFVYVVSGITTKDFYVLDPERVTIVPDDSGLPKAYRFRDVNGTPTIIPAKNVLVFTETNPKNWLKGFSALEASKLAHNSYEFAMNFNANMFANQGKMQGILSILGAEAPERRRIERLLQEKYQGAANAKKIMVTGEDPKWTPISNTPSDMEYIEGLREMRDQILSFFGVPRQLALADGTFNNTKEAQRIFAEYTLNPLLRMEESVYTEQLLPMYYDGMSLDLRKSYLAFDDAVEIDETERNKSANLSWEKGTMKLNEARRLQGLEDDPVDGDKYFWQVKPNTVVAPQNIDQTKDVKKKSKKQSDAARELLRQKIFTKIISSEEKFLKTTKAFFDGQADRVLKGVRNKKEVDSEIDINFAEEVVRTLEAYKDVYPAIAKIFNDQASEILNKEGVLSDSAKKQLQKNLEYFASEINKTTQKDLRNVISDAIENNLGLEETKKKIKELFDTYNTMESGTDSEMKLSRAEMIARTETNKIKSMVTYSRYKSDEDVVGYEWLATGGAGSRETHNEVDGLQINKGETFLVGGEEMRYPHDPKASAKNVINCRCDVLPVLKN